MRCKSRIVFLAHALVIILGIALWYFGPPIGYELDSNERTIQFYARRKATIEHIEVVDRFGFISKRDEHKNLYELASASGQAYVYVYFIDFQGSRSCWQYSINVAYDSFIDVTEFRRFNK